ncbi:hypothetical protein PaG_02977 [Moesziomyces aphidis]|uniref:Uncharacterized protein n=1 Tax=Moesziomyces aphidis TaxID=84754 RepID=W3VNR0_MOEAP|nr:hypothetical protein PaG_02977 [Moesziomyces aphidis]
MLIAVIFTLLFSAVWVVSGQAGPGAPVDRSQSQSQGQGEVQAGESVFGSGCRWDPTQSNIEEVTFTFRTGEAPPSTWFADVHNANQDAEAQASRLRRRADPPPPPPQPQPAQGDIKDEGKVVSLEELSHEPVLDASYHTRLIDVLTYRARYGTFGSSLNSAGCALPAFSERLAHLERQEREIVNNYTRMHKHTAGPDNRPNAMFFWAGLSNYDPNVRADLIQTVVFYGDGCAANPRVGLCVYAAEYSNFRYNAEDHMCMGSDMPVFYPVDSPMTVVYRTQMGFRTQESWIDDKMVSYLRSAGDQVMNSFVITQECKNCTWPVSPQIYSNIVLKFTTPEPHFDQLGLCTGGAKLKAPPRTLDGGKTWVIDEVWVPAGKHLTVKGEANQNIDAGNKGDKKQRQAGQKGQPEKQGQRGQQGQPGQQDQPGQHGQQGQSGKAKQGQPGQQGKKPGQGGNKASGQR